MLENLRLIEHSLISQVNGVALDSEIPVSEDLLIHKQSNETIDVLHLLLRINPTDGKAVTHSWTGSDTVRNTIDTAELRRQMDHVLAVLDDNERLVVVTDVLLIDTCHVLRDAHLFIVVDKHLVGGIACPVNRVDDVGAFIAPVSNNTRSDDFTLNKTLELLVIVGLSLQIFDLIEASNSGHEAEQGVYCDGHASLTRENRGFETLENLEVHGCQFRICDRSLIVEEFRVTTNLSQMGLTEGSFKNNIKDSLHNGVLPIDEFRIKECLGLRALLNNDLAGLVLVGGLDGDVFLNCAHGEDHSTRGDISSEDLIEVAILFLHNLVDEGRIENVIRNDS